MPCLIVPWIVILFCAKYKEVESCVVNILFLFEKGCGNCKNASKI